jgi:hypothetical protein
VRQISEKLSKQPAFIGKVVTATANAGRFLALAVYAEMLKNKVTRNAIDETDYL